MIAQPKDTVLTTHQVVNLIEGDKITKKLVLLLCMGTLALALFGCSKNPVGPQVVVVKRAVPAGDQVVVVKRSVPKAQVVVVKR